jgi:hypothetical protein
MRDLLRAKGTKGYTSRGAIDRPNTATFKPLRMLSASASKADFRLENDISYDRKECALIQTLPLIPLLYSPADGATGGA